MLALFHLLLYTASQLVEKRLLLYIPGLLKKETNLAFNRENPCHNTKRATYYFQ